MMADRGPPTFVISSEVEKSRGDALKLTRRDPSASLGIIALER
jgi:hypothetical protein